MRRFEIVQSTTAMVTSHSGLALVGRALEHTRLAKDLGQISLRHGIAHADCVTSYIGLLCTGSQHGQMEFIHFLERVVPRAKRLTKHRLLCRLDSGHDAAENRAWMEPQGVDFIIKWNPRNGTRAGRISKPGSSAQRRRRSGA